MPGGLTLLISSNADIPTPAAGKVTVFFSLEEGSPAYKDDAGNVFPLEGPTGSAGPQGPAGFGDDGLEPDVVLAMPGPQGNPGSTGSTGAVGPSGPAVLFINDDVIDDDMLSVPSAGGAVSSPWELAASQALSGAAQYNFTGLGIYTDLIVRLVGVTFGSGAIPHLRISVDNGANYLAASGDYVQVSGVGVPTNTTELIFYTTPATAARAGELQLLAASVTNAPKFSRAVLFSTDGVLLRYMPTNSPINALRLLNSGAVNFTGGTAYILGRR